MKMPTYEIFIDGKPRKIELTKTGENSFTVKIDDKLLNVKLQTSQLAMEKQFPISIGEKTYNVELPELNREKPFQLKVEEAAFKAEIKTPTIRKGLTVVQKMPQTFPTRTQTQRQLIEGAVTAPMTGKIISVKVKKGDHVEAGQVLCIIEAMKMENEINAPKTGTIQEVNVSAGSSVSEGEVLFIIG